MAVSSLHLYCTCTAGTITLSRVCVLLGREHLRQGEAKAKGDQQAARDAFRSWAALRVTDAQYMNVSSGAQIQQLFFAGTQNKDPSKGTLGLERVFKVSQQEIAGKREGGGGWSCIEVRALIARQGMWGGRGV